MGGREQWWEDWAGLSGARAGPTGGGGGRAGSPPWGISARGVVFLLVGRGGGGSEGDLVLLLSVGRAVACAGVVRCLHFGLVSRPVGIYINYHG